jgi:hypothetical protein
MVVAFILLNTEIVKKLAAFIFLFLFAFSSYAYISGIAIQTDHSSTMSVYINGRLYNKQPGKFVRILSKPGLFHVQVKVYNPYDKETYLIRKDIRVEKGYEFYYKIIFSKGKRPQIQAVKRYPVYSRYFLNPMLYNRHPIS